MYSEPDIEISLNPAVSLTFIFNGSNTGLANWLIQLIVVATYALSS